jgi:hypothetical protein
METNKMTEETKTPPNLLSVKLFTEQYPAFPNGSLRAYIWNEEQNGLKEAKAIIRIGKKKILIDVDKFFKWVQDQQNTAWY